jgi:hypothetical protein
LPLSRTMVRERLKLTDLFLRQLALRELLKLSLQN